MSTLADLIARRFHGRLMSGMHPPDSEACILEAVSVARGLTWTDNPIVVGLPDMRLLVEPGEAVLIRACQYWIAAAQEDAAP